MLKRIYLSFFVFSCLWGFSKIQSYIEHRIQKDPQPMLYVNVKWSLSFFKVSRVILFVIGSLEVAFVSNLSVYSSLLGFALVLLGVNMRIAAIKELGSMWYFHAARLSGQYRIRTGIYRYFRHPAYVGNIYITGLLLIFGAFYTAIVSTIFILLFYIIRTFHEERILNEIGRLNHV